MNQTIQEAADRYVSKEVHKVKGKMQDGYAGGLHEGFMAGAEWAQLKWIPVAERLPKSQQPVLFIVKSCDDRGHGIILGGKYTDHYFSTPGMAYEASHWCEIPVSLLNFKP
jgi:hypothetical protein